MRYPMPQRDPRVWTETLGGLLFSGMFATVNGWDPLLHKTVSSQNLGKCGLLRSSLPNELVIKEKSLRHIRELGLASVFCASRGQGLHARTLAGFEAMRQSRGQTSALGDVSVLLPCPARSQPAGLALTVARRAPYRPSGIAHFIAGSVTFLWLL